MAVKKGQKIDSSPQLNKENIALLISQLRNKSLWQLSKKYNIPYNTLCKWVKGTAIPREKFVKVLNFNGITNIPLPTMMQHKLNKFDDKNKIKPINNGYDKNHNIIIGIIDRYAIEIMNKPHKWFEFEEIRRVLVHNLVSLIKGK